MPGPGDTVKDENAYKEQDQAHRDYWEKGNNDNLTPEQEDKLDQHADKASKYDRQTRQSKDDVPRKPGTTDVDHGALVRNVKQYTADTLSPHGDSEPVAPPRPLGKMLDEAGTPTAPNGPSDGWSSGETNWVCINLAEFAAGLLRKLGYPVRETNVYLSRDGKWIYQSAALQVWFEGKWHWVDPFTCQYDPAIAWDEFTDIYAAYWDGTAPIGYHDWRVLTGTDWWASDWEGVDDAEVGNDLQRRFYPPPEKPDETGDGARPDKKGKKKVKRQLSRASAERPGCYISTPIEGVGLYLADDEGRVTDGVVREIPGSFHVAAGSPILYSNHALPDTPDVHALPRRSEEAVFFGAAGFDPTWDEVGSHALTLYVRGKSGTEVTLVAHGLGQPAACVEGVPGKFVLDKGIAALRIVVTVLPADAAFHVMFERMLAHGLVAIEDYVPALQELLACRACRGAGDPDLVKSFNVTP